MGRHFDTQAREPAQAPLAQYLGSRGVKCILIADRMERVNLRESHFGRGMIGVAAVAVANLLCFAGTEAPAASAATSSISGTVSDSVTEAPIEGVEVCATFYPDVVVGGCDTTDSSGSYQIDNLEPDVYGVSFETQFIDKEWLDWARATQGPIVLGSEPLTLDQQLKRYGRIEGVVTESGTGEPLREVWVCAFEYESSYGTACAYTDSSGSYLITGLNEPGDYKVRFIAPEQDGLLLQWYDLKEYEQGDTPDPVPVELADTTTGINGELFPGGRVEGTVRYSDGGYPLVNVWACAVDQSGRAWSCDRPDVDGKFAILGIPEGEYLIEFEPESKGIQTQYWDHKANPEDAELLSIEPGTTTSGIDGDLLPTTPPPGPPTTFVPQRPPPFSGSEPSPVPPKHCRKGFRRKRSGGKARCVRRKPRPHRARHSGAKTGIASIFLQSQSASSKTVSQKAATIGSLSLIPIRSTSFAWSSSRETLAPPEKGSVNNRPQIISHQCRSDIGDKPSLSAGVAQWAQIVRSLSSASSVSAVELCLGIKLR
jgi:hypothetical protein